ncbi:hypothetical protein [Cohnella kolymensis]|uniref:hypothetical protein n=1 Tax=Cohnella kolymensis TaxID=1590652 RepID=UPI000B2EAA65|nr:hypothetical protein [Cohnella kolymensis]
MKQSKDIIANDGDLPEHGPVNKSEDNAAEIHVNESSDLNVVRKVPRKSKGHFIVGD